MKPSATSIIGATLIVGVASEVVYYIWRHQLLSKLGNRLFSLVPTMRKGIVSSCTDAEEGEVEDDDPYFYKVLIFPDKARACKAHFWGSGCPVERCFYSHKENNSMYQFVSHIKKARHSLDVCVYVMTDHELANFVIAMKQKGVRVRVITNQEAQNYTGTQVGKFRANGIQVRTNINYLMHHKFVVVDQEIAITGSFNWTSHATTANNENMIVTNNPKIVRPFAEEFDRLWKEFAQPLI